MEPVGNANVIKNEVTAQMQAALRMFQSRRTHTCPGCGRLLGQRDELVRVVDLVYHRSCVPQRLETDPKQFPNTRAGRINGRPARVLSIASPVMRRVPDVSWKRSSAAAA